GDEDVVGPGQAGQRIADVLPGVARLLFEDHARARQAQALRDRGQVVGLEALRVRAPAAEDQSRASVVRDRLLRDAHAEELYLARRPVAPPGVAEDQHAAVPAGLGDLGAQRREVL